MFCRRNKPRFHPETLPNTKATCYTRCKSFCRKIYRIRRDWHDPIIRLFIRDPDATRDPAVRTAYGNLASLVGMACNLLLCIGKLVAGTLFGSIAIMADALNNLSDASSNIVSLIGFRLAASPGWWSASPSWPSGFRWARNRW